MRLASYKLKDVTHIWFTQWKDNKDDFAFCNSVLFSVSTPVVHPARARRVYKNYTIIVSQKVTSADLVELKMV